MPYAGLRNIPQRYQRGGSVGRFQEGGLTVGGGQGNEILVTPDMDAGKTLGDIFQSPGGASVGYASAAWNAGHPDPADYAGPWDMEAWKSVPATPESIGYTTMEQGVYKPNTGLTSGGPEGGYFTEPSLW